MSKSNNQIEEQLICSICKDRFKQPKILPCQHTFCLGPCLSSLVDWSTKRIVCCECRSIHTVPYGGLEALPNNLTIIKFLEMTTTSTTNDYSSSADRGVCFQCGQKKSDGDQLVKCLDCERFICGSCQTPHLAQLKNETRANLNSLRKMLPKLSERVGSIEQKAIVVNQSYESVKREIMTTTERLIEELKTREKCLLNEVDVHLQSQIRTINLEKENAVKDLNSVSSFCDSSETTINKSTQSHENEVALIRNECKALLKNYDNLSIEGDNSSSSTLNNKIQLNLLDLSDLVNAIRNLGSLTMPSNQQHQQQSKKPVLQPSQPHRMPGQQQQQQQQQQQTSQSWQYWSNYYNDERAYYNPNNINNNNINNNNNNNLNATTVNRISSGRGNQYLKNARGDDRPIMGGSRSIAFNADLSKSLKNTNNYFNYQSNINNKNSNNNNNQQQLNNTWAGSSSHHQQYQQQQQQHAGTAAPIRSSTFVLEDQSENQQPDPNQPVRQIDVNDLYNVARQPRARSPVAFNIVLNEATSMPPPPPLNNKTAKQQPQQQKTINK